MPVGRNLRERGRDRLVDRLRYGRAQHAKARRLLGEELGDERLGRRAGYGRLAGEHLVQHGGHGVHVAARVDGSIGDGLFGTHVLRRADRQTALRQPVPPRVPHRHRDAEVGEHREALVEQDVLRLDVSMHDTLSMRVVERRRDLPRDVERLVEVKLPLAIELGAQRFAADERHHVVQKPVRRPGVDQGEDVRMIEPRADADLVQEPLAAEHGGELRTQHLEGDVALVLEVMGEKNRCHPARADLALDAIAVRQHRGQPRAHLAHERPYCWKTRSAAHRSHGTRRTSGMRRRAASRRSYHLSQRVTETAAAGCASSSPARTRTPARSTSGRCTPCR